jgi:hypothetical protein
MIVRLLVQLFVAAMASLVVVGGGGDGGLVSPPQRADVPMLTLTRSTTRSPRNLRHRDLVIGTPTGGGKFPFLVIVAWKDLVADPRVRTSLACLHPVFFGE